MKNKTYIGTIETYLMVKGEFITYTYEIQALCKWFAKIRFQWDNHPSKLLSIKLKK